MFESRSLVNISKIKLAVCSGILLIVVGFALWFYPTSVIQVHEQTLNNPSISLEDTWQYEGSLQWWRTVATMTFYPAAFASIATSIAIVAISLVYAMHTCIKQTNAHDKWEKEIRRALVEI